MKGEKADGILLMDKPKKTTTDTSMVRVALAEGTCFSGILMQWAVKEDWERKQSS